MTILCSTSARPMARFPGSLLALWIVALFGTLSCIAAVNAASPGERGTVSRPSRGSSWKAPIA